MIVHCVHVIRARLCACVGGEVAVLMESEGQVVESGARTVGVRKPEGELNVGRHWAGEFMSRCGPAGQWPGADDTLPRSDGCIAL